MLTVQALTPPSKNKVSAVSITNFIIPFIRPPKYPYGTLNRKPSRANTYIAPKQYKYFSLINGNKLIAKTGSEDKRG
jgi:hypothetical protein